MELLTALGPGRPAGPEEPAARAHRHGRRQAGMTLIEVLIGSLLLLIIALGVIPLFVRATGQNTSAEIYTQMTNFARARIEEYRQLPFNSPELDLANPALPGHCEVEPDTELHCRDYWSREEERWMTTADGDPPPGDAAVWLRETTIRQFNLFDYMTSAETGAEPTALPAATNRDQVQLKEITVTLENPRRGGLADLGGSREFTARTLIAF